MRIGEGVWEEDREGVKQPLGFPSGSVVKNLSANAGNARDACRFDPWVRKIPWRRKRLPTQVFWPGEFHGLYSPWVEKAMAPHSSTLAWKIPWMEEPGRLLSMGLLRVGHNWATSLSLFTFMHQRRKWQPTPVFFPGESQDGGAWWAAVHGVAKSRTQLSDFTFTFHFHALERDDSPAWSGRGSRPSRRTSG